MSRSKLLPTLIGLFALAPAVALADDPPVTPLDLGMLHDREVQVVQKVLYPLAKRSELGLHLGVMPFDAYTLAPMGNFTWGKHTSDTFGWELAFGAGYGLKTSTYKEMEGPLYGVAPEAYRFLGRAIGSVEWTPVYAKLNWRGQKVLHHNVYFRGGAGLSVEQSVLPSAEIAPCPTANVGVGLRVFTGKNAALRVELADDVLLEKHQAAGNLGIKQNGTFTFGFTRLSKVR